MKLNQKQQQIRNHLKRKQQQQQGGPGHNGGGGGGPKPVPQKNPYHEAHAPMPWDANYETTVGELRNQQNQTMASLQAQQNQLQQDYGIGDHSNPYSKARLLQQAYQQSRAKDLNNYAAHGQLYAGSMTNARIAERDRYNQADDKLLRDYQSQMESINQSRLAARNDYALGLQNAEANTLSNALQNYYPSPDQAPPPGGGKGGGKGGVFGGGGKGGGGGGGKGGGHKGGHKNHGQHLRNQHNRKKQQQHIHDLLQKARKHDNNKRARKLRQRLNSR